MNNEVKHGDIIKKSHERSECYGIERERVASKKILTQEQLSENLKNNSELIAVAAPFIDILHKLLSGSGFIIILTDSEGCILNLLGDNNIIKAAMEMDMIPGAYMDERSIGTNAMGTAIKEDSPIQISATEHFINAYHKWTCSAAPIHDPQGQVIGTINLTGSSDSVHPHTLGLAVAAVKSIENEIISAGTKKKLIEANSYINTIMHSISSGIITVDSEGKVKLINKHGCKKLGLKEEEIVGSSISKTLYNWREIYAALENNKPYQDEEVIFSSNGTKQRYNLNAYPIRIEDGTIIGAVILIKEIQKVIDLVNKYTGMTARYSFEDIIGESLVMKDIIGYAKNISKSPSTVLIEGESGTGKEVLAQAIHSYSDRKNGGFVAINCGAIAKNLIESELFGYDDGAFTGAKKGGHPGKFELASGGTLFLDEIGEMPLEAQVNLLRVLQEGNITRVGGTKYIPVDVRIIAATNKDLKKEVEKGNFRQDLYYRLSVIPIKMPPLRERKEDIPALIRHFFRKKALKLGKNLPEIKVEIYNRMLNHPWPGNIRELENFIENMVNLNGKSTLYTPWKIEESIEHNSVQVEALGSNEIEELFISPLEDLEKRAIEACLKKFKGNISHVAKTLKISRNTLYLKMKKFGL